MSNKMWGGRFTRTPHAIMQDINASIDVDRQLFRQVAPLLPVERRDLPEIEHGRYVDPGFRHSQHQRAAPVA